MSRRGTTRAEEIAYYAGEWFGLRLIFSAGAGTLKSSPNAEPFSFYDPYGLVRGVARIPRVADVAKMLFFFFTERLSGAERTKRRCKVRFGVVVSGSSLGPRGTGR